MKTPHQSTLIAVLLFLAACSHSQLDRSHQKSLTPQLGHPNTSGQISVAVNQAGQIYTYSQNASFVDVPGGQNIEFFQDLTTSRYDRNGTLIWQNPPQPSEYGCVADFYSYFCPSSQPLDMAANSTGNTYTLTYQYSESCDHSSEAYNVWITKRSPSGAYLLSFDVTNAMSFALDASGNIYTVGNNDTGYGDYCDEGDDDPPYAEIIRKYSASGSLVWERQLSSAVGRPEVGIPTDVAIASNGNIYVAGSKGIRRYGKNGDIWWTKSGGAEEVVIAGSSIVTRSGLWVRALSETGTQRWCKFIGGSSPHIQGMDGDLSGNVYVAGSMLVGTNNTDAFVRKLSSSGTSQWTRMFGTPQRDEVTDIATYDGKEIYVVGTTQGRLSPANDVSPGYLYKLNNVGNRVWIR